MKKEINKQISQDAINRALWGACDTFRGTISADNYKDLILAMLFLKYVSDIWQDSYDKYKEEYGDEKELIHEMMKNERFILPGNASFYNLHKKRYEAGNGERIDEAFYMIEEANGNKLRDSSKSVFQDISFNSDKLGEEKQRNTILRHLLENFSKPELDLRPSCVGDLDIIGNAYEYLIKLFATGSGQKAGEFYTPPELSNLIAEILFPDEGDSICDPACGSGSLLIKCGHKIKERFNSKKYELYGQESIGSTWSLAKMNMFLHGEDNHKIEWGDTIRNPKLLANSNANNNSLMHFDVVIANPPFSLDKWGYEDAEYDHYGRFSRGIPPKNRGDYAFILHMIETMKPNSGRMGVIVAHGVLFRSGSEAKIRKQLIQENLLDCVIGLPGKLFYGTNISAVILIFKKNKENSSNSDPDQSSNILFIDASREFKAGRNQNILPKEASRRIIDTYLQRKTIDKYSYLASLDEIEKNDFNLNIARYVDTFEEEEELDLMTLYREREKIKEQIQEIDEQMDRYLKELGYNINKSPHE